MSCGNSNTTTTSSKMWAPPPSDDVDELFAVLGYNLRPSGMADVAQKIQHLEQVLGCSGDTDVDQISHLANDTVHYNPSDLSSWLGSMISGLDNNSSSSADDPFLQTTITANNNNTNNPQMPPEVDFDFGLPQHDNSDGAERVERGRARRGGARGTWSRAKGRSAWNGTRHWRGGGCGWALPGSTRSTSGPTRSMLVEETEGCSASCSG